jgi:preprotein translocase subunit YajC
MENIQSTKERAMMRELREGDKVLVKGRGMGTVLRVKTRLGILVDVGRMFSERWGHYRPSELVRKEKEGV